MAKINVYQRELYHHGILGQKWGRRQGPPYPLDAGDHSAAEKKEGWRKSLGGGRNESLYERGHKRTQKANFKSIKKIHSKTKDISRPFYRDKKTRKVIEQKITKSGLLNSEKTKKDIEDVKKLEDEWLKLEKSTEDFYESEESKNASKRAYDLTFDWFKKNDPEYLNSIIKDNGGSKEDLDSFHDFRKMYEGYVDEEWDKAKQIWDKTNAAKNRKQADKAWTDYYKKTKEIGKDVAKEILGNYGNKKLSVFDEYTYNDLVSEEVQAIINRMVL